MLTLTLTEKGNDPKEFSFEKTAISIGRNDDNDIVLLGLRVSSYHCRLMVKGSQILVEDLQSTNGTYINHVKIDEPTPATFADVVSVGDSILRIGSPPTGDLQTTRKWERVMDDLNPAAVLLCIRNSGGAMSLRCLREAFSVVDVSRPGSFFLAEDHRLSNILDRLARARLVEARGDNWAITPMLRAVQDALELSLTTLARGQTPRDSDTASAIDEASRAASTHIADGAIYRADMLRSLDEMKLCFENGCYTALLGLAGKVLEISLKQKMDDLGVPFDDNWMLGTLVAKLKKERGEQVGPGFENVINIINQSRIPAVHAKREIPIPSKEQAIMVVGATLDMLKRTLLPGRPTRSS